MYYENSETRVSIYSILMEIIKETEETQFENGKNRHSTNKKIEAFIGKLRWEKKTSNKIIENEQCLIQECDEVISILNKIRRKE